MYMYLSFTVLITNSGCMYVYMYIIHGYMIDVNTLLMEHTYMYMYAYLAFFKLIHHTTNLLSTGMRQFSHDQPSQYIPCLIEDIQYRRQASVSTREHGLMYDKTHIL